jgi:hypothetical protein
MGITAWSFLVIVKHSISKPRGCISNILIKHIITLFSGLFIFFLTKCLSCFSM